MGPGNADQVYPMAGYGGNEIRRIGTMGAPREDDMSQEYDATLKTLAETSPADWPPLLGLRRARVTIGDADIATVVSGATDKVLHVHDRPEYLLHLDFQSGHDTSLLPGKLRLYSAVLEYRSGLLVRSAAVLLRPEADSPQLTGRLERAFPGEAPYAYQGYLVLRVWQMPPERFLKGGLGMLPLAPISNVREAELPRVIRRMKQRLSGRRERARAPDLWAATYVLLGLRYSEEFAQVLLQGVLGMKESVTYQAILREGLREGRDEGLREGRLEGRVEGRFAGRIEEAQRLLLVLGEERFGAPDAATRATVEAITEVQDLERLARELLRANSWQELLGMPPRRRRNGRR
jgi:predicted transposase YdaD